MPVRPHVTSLNFEYATESLARVVERSLRQEVGDLADDRSTATIARDGRRLELIIDAADLVALRAAANTWLSLTDVAERVAETVDF